MLVSVAHVTLLESFPCFFSFPEEPPHPFHSLPGLLGSIHAHLLVILPSPRACPLSAWGGGAFAFGLLSVIQEPKPLQAVLVRVLLPWISAQLRPSPPLGLCSNINFSVRPSFRILYKTAAPLQFSLGLLSLTYFAYFFPHCMYHCLTVCLLSVFSF